MKLSEPFELMESQQAVDFSNGRLQTTRRRKHKGDSSNNLEKKHLMEVLMQSKRNELEMAVQRTNEETDIIMRSNQKAPSRSPNSSQFRGVFKNGSKWQVS